MPPAAGGVRSAVPLGAAARGLVELVELVLCGGRDDGGRAVELEHHAGEGLADLVVLLAGDAPALGLLHC